MADADDAIPDECGNELLLVAHVPFVSILCFLALLDSGRCCSKVAIAVSLTVKIVHTEHGDRC